MLQCRPAQEFCFGPRALKEALVSTDPALQEHYVSAFTPAERLFLAEAYNPRRTLFCTLLIRTAFDWLLSRPEAPEDFQTFHASLPSRRQSPARKHIYLQPIDLSEGPAGSALLEHLRNCTEAFFLGLQVRCLPSVAAASIHCCSRPSQDSDRLQLHTDGILSFLKNSKPGDALCVLGLTLSDLYPCEAWSFTFGKFLPGHETSRLDASWDTGAAQPGRRAAVGGGGHPPRQRRLGPELWERVGAGQQPVGAPDPRRVEPQLPRGAGAGARGGAGLAGRPREPAAARTPAGGHRGARAVAGAVHPGPGARGDGGRTGAGGRGRGCPGRVGDVHGAAPSPQAGPALRPRRHAAAQGPGGHVLLPAEETEHTQTVQGGIIPLSLEGGGELTREPICPAPCSPGAWRRALQGSRGSGENSAVCRQGQPVGFPVPALTASFMTSGSSRTFPTPSNAGHAKAASLSGVCVSLRFCHPVFPAAEAPACTLGCLLCPCSRTSPVAAGREAAGANSSVPAASSVVMAASPSWKEARIGVLIHSGASLQFGG
ncbi:archaemetzincin-1 isoform X1 [Zalophus californianus]|uniref:Archaemetzincin-1 isoform X1 n=1 Tax=Zalophus californianus TaxID=9704 RepID=A0A6J2E9E7_ZALCA|nr:archaemetzincin-1 isoform X1 [Zalophus californianus]